MRAASDNGVHNVADFFKRLMSKFSNYDDEEGYDVDYETSNPAPILYDEPAAAPRQSQKVMNFQAPDQKPQIIVIKPDSIDAAREISNNIRAGRTVVCNFEQIDQKVAQRVMDFITGSSYALDAHVHQITSVFFVVTPRSVTFINTQGQEQRRGDYGRGEIYSRWNEGSGRRSEGYGGSGDDYGYGQRVSYGM